jgi:uncharacterized LabA/DUF88 family protein
MLIDGDNSQPSLVEKIFAEVTKYGSIIIRRIYGDWTSPNMNSWKGTLHKYAIQPIQQFRFTTGKNATDSAMIIDAMDLLYNAKVNGFCLVSSDSDFTRLATRLRENSLLVIGIGKRNTPLAFINACDVFVFTEDLSNESDTVKSPKSPIEEKILQNSGTFKPTVEKEKQPNAKPTAVAKIPKEIQGIIEKLKKIPVRAFPSKVASLTNHLKTLNRSSTSEELEQIINALKEYGIITVHNNAVTYHKME